MICAKDALQKAGFDNIASDTALFFDNDGSRISRLDFFNMSPTPGA